MRQLLKHPVMKHPLVFVAVFLMIAIVVVIPIAVFASTPTFTEYPLQPSTAHPAYIVTGPDGNIWFTEMENNKVGYINPTTRKITEYSLPQDGVSPYYNSPTALTKGPDGNLWFTDEFTEKISKITPSGTVTEYALPNGLVQPDGITTGPDGNLWITAYSSNYIAVMNTSGSVIHQYAVTGGPEGISVGPDKNIWFAEQNAHQIVKMNPGTGAMTSYPLPTLIEDTAPGTDGNEWFTLGESTQVGKINPSTGTLTYYNLPSSTGYVASFIAPGPDGNMWFSLNGVGIGMVDPTTGSVATYVSPSASTGGAWGITAGPDKNIWYTLNNNYSVIGVANIGLSEVSGSGGSNSGSGGSTSGSSGSGSSTGTGTSSGGSGSSSGSGSRCPTPQSNEHSESGCGVAAPGHNKSPVTTPAATVTSTATTSGGVIVQAKSDGTTTATVSANLKIGQTYEVPNEQTLYVDGNLTKAIADKGATVKGDGEIDQLTVNKGANVSPGHSPGCITSTALTMDGTYNAQIGGTTACKGYDQLIVKGTVTLSGELNVSLVNGFHPQPGQSFAVINNEGKSAVNGTFADLSEGSIFVSNNIPYTITYKGGDGNDVVLKALTKDAYLSALTSNNTSKKVAVSQNGIIPFIKRNATVILTTLIVALAIVIGIIYHLIRAQYYKEPKPPVATSIANPSPPPVLQ